MADKRKAPAPKRKMAESRTPGRKTQGFKTPGLKTPGDRLAALGAEVETFGKGVSASMRVMPAIVPSSEKVRFKWIVKHKGTVAAIVGQQIETRYQVQLEAAFEPLSILDGQAVVQGNLDNRAFGIDVPKAAISMEITSQAIADTFVVGRAYHSDFSPVEPVIRPLY